MSFRAMKSLMILGVGLLVGGCAQFWGDLNRAAVWNWGKEPPGVQEGREVRNVAAGELSFRKPVKSWKELKWEHVVRQDLDFSCGAAALATIFQNYHGTPITEEEIIRHIFKTGDIEKIKKRQGFSLLDLKKFAESREFTAQGYRMDFDTLARLGKPALVPIVWRGYDHFVVFRGLHGDRVYLADPAYGKLTMKADSFIEKWKDGIVFVLTNGKEPPPDHKLGINGNDDVYVDAHSLNRLTLNTGIRTILRPEF